jgi:hypothetical protein
LQTQGLACSKGDVQTLITVGAKLARDGALAADKYFPDAPGSNWGSWLAGDGGLTADEYFPDVPGSNCGSWLAGDGGLIGGEIFAGVHIHSCVHGFYWFRFYSESLGKTERRPAPSNQRLLPLSYGASLRLGIPSLRSCSVGPPRSAIHGRARLTRHPCRVAHCAEPALGLPKGQEDQGQNQNQKQINSRSTADQMQKNSFTCSAQRFKTLLNRTSLCLGVQA